MQTVYMCVQANRNTNFKFMSRGITTAARDARFDPASNDFDTDSLAYECLSGFVHMRLKSMAHYSGILREVIEERYHVPLTVQEYHMESGGVPRDLAISHTRLSAKEAKVAEKAIADSVRYPKAASANMLGEASAIALRIQTNYGKSGTAAQRQQLHVYAMVTERFGVVLDDCDAAFFKDYVGTFVESEAEGMVKQFYALQRFHHALNKTAGELVHMYRDKLKRLNVQQEADIAMYNTRQHQFYQPAIALSKLMDALDVAWRAKVLRRELLEIPLVHFLPAVASWVACLQRREYTSLNAVLGITPRKGSAPATRGSLLAALSHSGDNTNPTATATNVAKAMLMRGFGLNLKPHKGEPRRKPIDFALYAAMVDTYGARSMMPPAGGMVFPDFAFVPDDDVGYPDVADGGDEEASGDGEYAGEV